MASNKRTVCFRGIAILFCLLIVTTLSISCGDKLPKACVGSMEANHPWMIYDPTLEQGILIPRADRKDPNVLYLVGVDRQGDAVKVDLKNKTTSPYHFDVQDSEDVDMFLNRYKIAYGTAPWMPGIWREFRGRKEVRLVKHTFGYPVPNQSGTTRLVLRTGYHYVMDKREGREVELLRVKIENADLGFGGLGETYVSPDKKWLVFTLSGPSNRVFIFNREAKTPERFPTEREYPLLEKHDQPEIDRNAD